MRNHFILKRMADDSLFLIDIDKVLREKAPKYYKYIPKFVVSYLKRIVHQEELNVFLRESKDKVGVDFLKACLEFLDANIVVKGEENLPTEGLYTLSLIIRWEARMVWLWDMCWVVSIKVR